MITKEDLAQVILDIGNTGQNQGEVLETIMPSLQ